jgi:hypothetical protein
MKVSIENQLTYYLSNDKWLHATSENLVIWGPLTDPSHVR